MQGSVFRASLQGVLIQGSISSQAVREGFRGRGRQVGPYRPHCPLATRGCFNLT